MDLRYRNVRGERYTLDDLIDVTFRITDPKRYISGLVLLLLLLLYVQLKLTTTTERTILAVLYNRQYS